MLIYNPYTFYNYLIPHVQVGLNIASFWQFLFKQYKGIPDNIYVEEMYAKALKSYKLFNDIMNLYHGLIMIHHEIINTPQEERLLYKEYLEKYKLDCIITSIFCQGINIKPLMVAFDNGYENINGIPTIINPLSDDYIEGIGWFRISGDTAFNNDFIIENN
jgi:hypothetical protein